MSEESDNLSFKLNNAGIGQLSVNVRQVEEEWGCGQAVLDDALGGLQLEAKWLPIMDSDVKDYYSYYQVKLRKLTRKHRLNLKL